MIRVLFVCTGNICRSPLAEGLFNHYVLQRELSASLIADSAGTHSQFSGRKPDRHSIAIAKENGLDISNQLARLVDVGDFYHHNYIFAMTLDQRDFLEMECPKGAEVKIDLISKYLNYAAGVEIPLEIPDPYHGGMLGFAHVYQLLDNAVEHLLIDLVKIHNLK